MTEPRKTPMSKVTGLAAMLERFTETYHACASNEADRWEAGRLLEAAKQLRALEIETQELAGLLEDVLDFIGEPPLPNCSCHISPPCNDCVDHAEAREINSRIESALTRHRAKQGGAV